MVMVAKNEKGRPWPTPMFFSELLAVSCRLSGLRRLDTAFLPHGSTCFVVEAQHAAPFSASG